MSFTRIGTITNSGVSAEKGTLTLKTGNDANISGANLLAKNVALNIGNNLNVESKQTEEDFSSSGFGFNFGAGGKKGKTTTDEITEIIQKASTLNFSGDLNTQSTSDTNITASKLTADNATILTGKLRDSVTGIDIITNSDAKLNINSAFNIKDTNSTTERVKPNYLGIAVVAGGSALVANSLSNYLTTPVGNLGPVVPIFSNGVVATAGTIYTGYSGVSNANPKQKTLMDPLMNIRSKENSSSHKQTEIKTDLNFNNLITN